MGSEGGLWRDIRMMPINELFLLGLIAVVSSLLVPQFITVALVQLITGHDFEFLNIFATLGLWGAADPAARYGVTGAGVMHWLFVLAQVGLVAGVIVLMVLWNRASRKNPQNRDGQASVRDVQKELGPKQLLGRVGTLRPAYEGRSDLEPCMLGYRVGSFRGVDLWLRIEDPTIVIGPSRSGKGWYLINNWILNAPGAVITTSTRLDNAAMTKEERKRQGPVRIFAPGVEGGTAIGDVLCWDAVDGCVEEETLVRRVKGFIPSGAFAGSTNNGGHWDTLGQQLAAHLFHAAACGGLGVEAIWEWVGSPKRAERAVELIRDHPAGLSEHANHLETVLSSPPEQLQTQWAVLPTVLSFMESRIARRWMTPEPHEQVDLASFILQKGTLYLVGDKVASRGYAKIIAGLLAEIDYVTKGLADASPGTRLDPPVSYLIDEAGSFEYEGKYELITAGGGRGRVGVLVYQSKNQLEEEGGPGVGATLWDAAVAKIILPGGSDEKALRETSNLIGEVWVDQVSHTVSDSTSRSYSRTKRAIIEPSEIRELPEGTGLLFYRRLKPLFWKGTPFHEHPRYEQCRKDMKPYEQLLRQASPFSAALEAHRANRDA